MTFKPREPDEYAEFDENESIEGKLGFEKNLFIQIRACMENLSQGDGKAWNSINTLCDSVIFYQPQGFKDELKKIDAELEAALKQVEGGVKGHQIRHTARLNAAAKKFRLVMNLLGEKGVLLKKSSEVSI